MSYLLLWLEAPLQSWGYESRFGIKTTLEFPTKSGIRGLMCAAMGAGGEQADWLEKMQPCTQLALRYSPKIDGREEPLPLVDFHMVGSGYDDKDPWLKLFIPRKVDGQLANTGGTKMTYRHYLQNAFFAVVAQVPEDEVQRVIQGLEKPVWSICLGRKCCVPTDYVYRGCFRSEEEAVAAADRIATNKGLVLTRRLLDGSFEDKGEVMTINDVPTRFGLHKRYQSRQVTIVSENDIVSEAAQ